MQTVARPEVLQAARHLAGEDIVDAVFLVPRGRFRPWVAALIGFGIPIAAAAVTWALDGPWLLVCALGAVAGQFANGSDKLGKRWIVKSPTRLWLMQSRYTRLPNSIVREVDAADVEIGPLGRIDTPVRIGNDRFKVTNQLIERLRAALGGPQSV